jgi:protein-S-isoprenylcysteine O-methyltransferase Ste14
MMRPGLVILGLWILWALSWALAALWSSRAQGRPDLGSQIRYRIPMVIGILLLLIPSHRYEGPLRLWHVGWIGAWTCVGLEALGILFAWWARIHLGTLWSGNVTRKADHRVVDSGPYGIVRHPIYTGLLLALLATAAAKGVVWSLGGFLILLGGLWLKARQEEQWLRRELGAEAYDAYRSRVPMLVPFLPAAR